MLIKKDKTDLQQQSHRPNENWLGDEYYLVEDDTPLAEKILASFPYVDFVVENGVIVDVTILEQPGPFEGLTNTEIRARLYAEEQSIEWDGSMLTVDAANTLFNDYLAENNIDVVNQLTEKIQVAKNDIRVRYPIENEEIHENGKVFADMEAENKLLKAQVNALSEQNAFHEELFLEIAMKIYE